MLTIKLRISVLTHSFKKRKKLPFLAFRPLENSVKFGSGPRVLFAHLWQKKNKTEAHILIIYVKAEGVFFI